MTRVELPRTLNLDAQRDMGKAFMNAFPDGDSSHLRNFRGMQALGYKENSQRKVTDTISMTHGHILYGHPTTYDAKSTVCALPARILFSPRRQALEALEETDRFLDDYPEHVHDATSRFMKYNPQRPYKKQHIIRITPESGIFRNTPLSHETVYACLYLPEMAIERKIKLPEEAKLSTLPPLSIPGYYLQEQATQVMFSPDKKEMLFHVQEKGTNRFPFDCLCQTG